MPDASTQLVERERWINHKGRRILCHDYAGLLGEQFVNTLQSHAEAVQRRNESGLLVLIFLSDTTVDREVLKAFKSAGSTIKPFYNKVAMVGVTGIQKLFVQVTSAFVEIVPKQFDSEDAALDWLVE